MSSSQEENSDRKQQRKTLSPEIQSILSTSTKMSENSKFRGKITRKQVSQKNVKPLDMTSDDISEITNSDYHESMFTSKSDILSYRDKLKNRFNKIKQTGKVSNRRNKSGKTFRSHANNIITLNRSIDLMKKENITIESQIRSYKRCDSKESDEELVSKTERYQFFCEALPDSWLLARFPNDESEEEISKYKKETIDDGDNSILVEFKSPEFRGDEVNIAEADHFWRPNRTALRIEEKVTDQPRIFQEEGLYVSESNKIPEHRLNILEQRLHSFDDKRWFDASGKMILLEDPYSKTSFRPDEYSTSSKLELEYHRPKAVKDISTLNSIFVPQDDILEINIHNIKFKHHPLFSTEHVLQQRLIEFYDIYREYTACNKLDRLQKKLDGLRKALNTLKDNVNASGDGLENTTIQTYRSQIKKLRKELIKESKSYRENLKLILNTWKCIKKVREVNKFSSTPIKLFIRKEDTDSEKEEIVYQIMFEETLEEIISEQESEHRHKMVEYKKALNAWKRLSELDQEKDSKPQKPSKDVDIDAIRSKLEQDFQKCFKTPGEPILYFNINYENDISRVTDDSKEILRRNTVSGTKIFLKFFCNNMEVCKSKMKPLSDNFVCHFEEYFSLKLTSIPESVLMEIYEQTNTLVKRKIAQMKLKIPLRNVRLGQSKIGEDTFVREESITYKHNGVGSNITMEHLLSLYNIPNFLNGDILQTSGFINFNMGWDANSFDVTDNPEFKLSEDVLDSNGSIDIEKLHKWIEVAQPDPQDPKYSVIFDFLNECLEKPSGSINKKKYFRCDPYAFPIEVFTKADIEENIRFKLLELRDKNVPEFVGMAIPNRIKEIPTNVFSNYERRLAEENNEEYLQEDEYEYEINTHRSQGRKYIRQMHTKIFQLCRNSENNLTFEDIVNEKTIPFIQLFIRNIIFNFLNWFKIRPALSKPLPTINFQEESTNILENKSSSKITICLKGGLNIPNRRERTKRKFSRSQSVDEDLNIGQVKSFVEVCYEQFISFSSEGVGTNPTWNDEIQFPLEMNNVDYLNPNVLNGFININLYDDLSQEDAKPEDIKETHFLGSVHIPVSAIAESQKLEGLFLIKTPAMLLGYEKSEDLHHLTRAATVSQTYINYTYINMKICIEPNIPKLSPDMQSLPSSEPPYLRDHIMEWNMKFNTEHSQRKFSALAIDSNGRTVCVTRYIKSLEPPQINADGFDVTPDQCARYVSMIPFTESNKFYQNIWLSTEQMLKLGIGSVIDHAIALVCYFYSLNVEAWLILGFGLPHGSMAFVLIREYPNDSSDPLHYIYDVTSGFKYNVTDPYCPLKKIYCVINNNNLWANVQRGDDIITTRFDFSRRLDWSPLFNKQITSPSNSVQQKLIYVSTFDTQKIQSSIEKKLKKKFAKLRKHDRTVWNHYLCNILKNSMSKFEVNMMHGKTYMEIPEVEEMEKGYKITGCLINLPFYSVGGIVEKVINMKLHQVDGNFEFAVGVHVQAYPNQVISVWAVVLRVFRKS